MPVVNIARRLTNKILRADIDSLSGLNTVPDYVPARDEATAQALQLAYQTMLAKQRQETEVAVTLKAAADAAKQAEWDFHNAILAMKESIKGQFGVNSNAAQAVGYKKKSEYKRRRTKAKVEM